MFTSPPKEREALSWLFVVLWSGATFLAIPFVRLMTDFVDEQWGRQSFTYGVVIAVAIIAAVALLHLWRQRAANAAGLFWIIGVAIVYVYLIFDLMHLYPEEAVHYLLYGGLGIVLFRAFAHRVRDVSIYILALLAGSIVGIVDEAIQWIVPGRHFDIRDIWLNVTGVALMQFALAMGFRPSFISGVPSLWNIQKILFVSAILAAVLGLCHQNTPENVADYSRRFTALEFLQEHHDVMFEYGYRYDDPEIGSFKSRLTLEELEFADQSRAQTGAELIDKYPGYEGYIDFLDTYPAVKDAFLHEARVHIRSRDVNIAQAERAIDVEEGRRRYTFAYREHQILESYFTELYAASSYTWPDDVRMQVETNQIDGLTRLSRVSEHLVTWYTAKQALWFFSLLVFGLFAAACTPTKWLPLSKARYPDA